MASHASSLALPDKTGLGKATAAHKTGKNITMAMASIIIFNSQYSVASVSSFT